MYYPKSQIKTNLYTNGEDFFLTSTGERYTGFYHMISSNQFFTGKTPNTPPIRRLTPNPQPTDENLDGSFLKNEEVYSFPYYRLFVHQKNSIFKNIPIIHRLNNFTSQHSHEQSFDGKFNN